MDPFKVICVTCHAKLSVRNEALIGQIVGCPRCGSMVEVAQPANTAPAAPEVASTPSAESTINLTARQIEEVTQAVAADEPTPESQSAPVETGPAEPTHAEAAETVPADVLQASAEVAKFKIITWSLASFVIGATLVGAIVYRSSRAPVPPVAESTPEDVAPTPETSPSVEAVVATSEQELPPAIVQPEVIPDQVAAEPEEVVPSTPEVTNVSAEQSAPPVAEPDSVEPISREPEADETRTLTIEPAPRAAPRFDPFDFDLESLSLAKLDQPREQATQAVDVPEADVDDVPDEPEPVEVAPTEPPIVRIGQVSDPAANNRSAEEQLKLKIPALQFDNLPLLDALDLVAQLSGQPVSVAPEQLLMAGVTAGKKVSVDVSDTSLDKVLDEILSPLRMEYTTSGPHIIVQRQKASQLREISYPIDDLASDALSTEQLAGWIEQLVAPTTWQASGGNGSLDSDADRLRITQPQHVQYQILILLERLRLARKLPPQSRFPIERLVGAPAMVQLDEKLSAPTTFTFTQPTPLNEIFAHWQTELGVPLLVDWPALAAVERYPTTPVACAIVEEPWQVALDKVLTPLGLGWRAATGGAIEITSAANASEGLQLELLPVTSLNEAKLAQLQALAAQHGMNPAATVVYDTVGKVLIASQPATALRAIYRELQSENLLDVR